MTPSFHFEILGEFVPVFSEQSEIMSSLIEKKAGQEVDVIKYIKNSTLDIICGELPAHCPPSSNRTDEIIQCKIS